MFGPVPLAIAVGWGLWSRHVSAHPSRTISIPDLLLPMLVPLYFHLYFSSCSFYPFGMLCLLCSRRSLSARNKGRRFHKEISRAITLPVSSLAAFPLAVAVSASFLAVTTQSQRPMALLFLRMMFYSSVLSRQVKSFTQTKSNGGPSSVLIRTDSRSSQHTFFLYSTLFSFPCPLVQTKFPSRVFFIHPRVTVYLTIPRWF
jgi:hypothetical protein